MKILVLNSGSSSQKACIYDLPGAFSETPPHPLWQGKIEWDGNTATATTRNANGSEWTDQSHSDSRANITKQLLEQILNGKTAVVRSFSEIAVVGHRIVNGGPDHRKPEAVTPAVKAAITDASSLSPLHNRAELDGIELIENTFGNVRQVVVFDTGFHATLPDETSVYAGPYEWLDLGIRRYGFHGINHQYCAGRAAHLLKRDLTSLKLVSCHLGNGCSLAAIDGGRSIDTTMGFTPLEGLAMGTRSGSIDPAILTFLMRKQGKTSDQLDEILNKKSGLLGISGLSGDMREIVSAMTEGNARAKLAFDIFVHRLRSSIGSMIATLGGIDALIFTAGIGENSPEVRSAACSTFAFLGLKLDALKNESAKPDTDISAPDSKIRVLVIEAQEDWAIAKECWKLSAKS
jgi:acetate kinase